MVGALSRAYYPINLHRANNLSVCSWVHIGPCAICMSLLNALAAMLCLAVGEDPQGTSHASTLGGCLWCSAYRDSHQKLVII